MQSLVKEKILLVEIQESSMEVPDMFMLVSGFFLILLGDIHPVEGIQ